MKRPGRVLISAGCVLLAGVVALGFFAAGASAQTLKIKVGCLESPEGANTLGWKTFEQYVESMSGGGDRCGHLPIQPVGRFRKNSWKA